MRMFENPRVPPSLRAALKRTFILTQRGTWVAFQARYSSRTNCDDSLGIQFILRRVTSMSAMSSLRYRVRSSWRKPNLVVRFPSSQWDGELCVFVRDLSRITHNFLLQNSPPSFGLWSEDQIYLLVNSADNSALSIWGRHLFLWLQQFSPYHYSSNGI